MKPLSQVLYTHNLSRSSSPLTSRIISTTSKERSGTCYNAQPVLQELGPVYWTASIRGPRIRRRAAQLSSGYLAPLGQGRAPSPTQLPASSSVPLIPPTVVRLRLEGTSFARGSLRRQGSPSGSFAPLCITWLAHVPHLQSP